MKNSKWFNHLGYLSPITVVLMVSGCDGGLARNTDQADGQRASLVNAVIDNDAEAVKAFLAQGRDVNATDANGYTLLQQAINSAKPNLDMVKLLVAAGADVNKDNPFSKENAFDMAIAKDVAIASYLADQGAKVRSQAFAKIANNGQLDAVKLVFQKNTAVTVEPQYLDSAIENGHQDAALELLKGDATLTGLSSGFEKAVKKGMPAVVKAIVNKDRLKGNNTSRLLGDYVTDDQALAALLSAGVDPNGVAKDGVPLLHYLAKNNDPTNPVDKAVQLLAANGADVNLPVFKTGYYLKDTPLHLAAYTGNSVLVEYLLAHGARPSLAMLNDVDYEGTPLHVAVIRSNNVYGLVAADRFLETVKKLLAGGADKTKTNANGKTPWQSVKKASNMMYAQYKLLLQ